MEDEVEDISPDMGALSLSSTRESVRFIDPFRDDPCSEDNTDPDSESDKSSEDREDREEWEKKIKCVTFCEN